MREPRELIEECKKHLRDTKQYQHEYKNDIRKLITALERALTIPDVVGRSEQFKCHSCGTNHSGKNDDQLYEVCRTCFDGI